MKLTNSSQSGSTKSKTSAQFIYFSLPRSPFIEDFLKSATAQQPETTTMFDLLWKFYEKSGQYVAAAKILNKLADRHSTDLRYSKMFIEQ